MRVVPPWAARLTALLGAASLISTIGGTCLGGAGAEAAAVDGTSWTVYHHDPAGSGVIGAVADVNTNARAWTSPVLDGQLYGEPLVSGGKVYVATEGDTVYALSSSTGAVTWSTHIAVPVPAAVSLPCGDIQPTVGITGTPVIDEARGELFVVADEEVRGVPEHVLVGLSTNTGQIEMTRNVDPTGTNHAALLQRTGLALDAGQVVFGFGGNYGDCPTYRGWVVAVAEGGGPPADFAVDGAAGQSRGAVWMGGAAPAVDGRNNIWVTAGNGSVTSDSQAYDGSDSVLELSPSLRRLQFFAPSTWAEDNANDLDLSMEPALLADGQVVVAGKSKIAFLLDGARLGGIGGEVASLTAVCGDDVDGGSAVVGTTVYLPCLRGIVAVGASPTALHLRWSSGVGGGPPIVAAGLVWTIGSQGTLFGLDPATGSVRQQAPVGPPANHFPTPSVGDGVLVAASATRVVAFTASPGGVVTTRPVPTTTGPDRPRIRTPAANGSGSPSEGVIAGVGAAVVVAAAAFGWMRWRRRT